MVSGPVVAEIASRLGKPPVSGTIGPSCSSVVVLDGTKSTITARAHLRVRVRTGRGRRRRDRRGAVVMLCFCIMC